MAAPVTVTGSFTCQHHGTASLAATAPPEVTDKRLTVNRDKVVLFTGAAFFGPYDGCGAPTPPAPCVSTTALPANPGQSRLLTVGGAPVLLSSVQATSQLANTPLQSVSAGQSVLTAS